jgi:hypothetical protein
MVLKLGHFGKYIRNTLKGLKSVLEITWVDRVKDEEA